MVDTVTTDEDGFAKSKELYLGKYTVVETKAPTGMVINKEKHSVELTYAGQDVAVTEIATSFVNERQKVKISLGKILEQDETFGIGKNDEIKNISFGLYAKEDIVSSSGTVIPADGLIEIITLDENGTAIANTDLPFGSYYIKEIATDEHYILSDTHYPFTFEYAGQDTEIVEIKVNDGKPIENKLIYGSVSGKKIDENGEALGGALIGIFKADETVFTREHALMTAVSQKDGSFSFAKVPYGNWIVREIEAPTGFVLDDTSYEVNISENEQVVEIEITNEYIHGNIQLTKVDADYPDNKLTGATFEVYRDVNGDGKLDDGDELIGNLKETSTGIYEMKELLYGKYLVRETKAPDGFELDKGVYSVFIENDETTYNVENKAGVGFINQAMKGNLKIKKTSSDGKVEGFTFRVTGENGYDRSFTTDKNGEIFIEGLRIGEYTVSEVGDNVSAGYVLPADKKASVKVGSTTVVEMHNVLRDAEKMKAEKEAVYQMADDAAKAIVSDPEKFKAFLDTQSRLDRYSAVNALLIFKQLPEASQLKNFDDWSKDNIKITKGAKSISILEPVEYAKRDGTTGISYNVKKVFDVSQTNGKRPPAPTVNRDPKALITTMLDSSPVNVEAADDLPYPNMAAFYNNEEQTLYVKRDVGDSVAVAQCVAQELGHAQLSINSDSYSRSDMGFQAVCIGYMLCKKYGIDTQNFAINRIPDKLANKEPKDIRYELSKTRNAMADIHSRVSDELYKKKQARSKDYER